MKSANFHTYLICGTLFSLFMAVSHASQSTQPASTPAPPAAKPVAREVIHTHGLRPALDQQVIAANRTFGARGQSLANLSGHWMYAETDDWVLLNGSRGTVTCPAILGKFGAEYAASEAMSLSTVRTLADRAAGGAIALAVLVPRFATAPAGLAQCSGFAFDAKTGRLRAGGKYVAYLTPVQPLLATASR